MDTFVSFFATALACRKAIARVPRINFGDCTGELFDRCFGEVVLLADGLGGTAGGTVARFIGGE